jgi:hypothetical protein
MRIAQLEFGSKIAMQQDMESGGFSEKKTRSIDISTSSSTSKRIFTVSPNSPLLLSVGMYKRR